MRNISQRKLLQLSVPLPPLDEQRRIVDLLERAAGIRRLREQALAKARAIVPALFLDMFGDPATNPKGWPVAQLGDILADIEGGWSPKCDGEAPGPSEWGILKLGAVTWGEFNQHEAKRLPATQQPRPDLEIQAGDVLLSRKNTHELVGACAYVWETRPRLMMPDLIFRLRLTMKSLLPITLWAILSSASKRQEIRKLASGSAESMPNIAKSRLRKLSIPMPPRDLQHAFADRLTDLRAIIGQQERSLAVARDLERSLMASLLG